MAHKGEGQTAKVAAAAKATYHHIGVFFGHSHLLFGFKSDDSLVQCNMVEHRAERIFAVGCCCSKLHRLADSRAKCSLMQWVARDDVFTCPSRH